MTKKNPRIVQKHSNTKAGPKSQILLCNTNRNSKDYLTSLKSRANGKYKKIPNYLIEKSGKVHNLNKDDVTEYYLNGYETKGVIVICLENLGWFKRRREDGRYVTWLGDIYNKKVYEKKWRGKLFWDEYTDKQMDKTLKLIEQLCEEYNVPKEFIGHNVLVNGVEKFNGVVSRSNYNEFWVDINPSFNFKILCEEKH